MPDLDNYRWRRGSAITAGRLTQLRDSILSVIAPGRNIQIEILGSRLVISAEIPLRNVRQYPLLYVATTDAAGGEIDVKRVESDGTTTVGNARTVKVIE